MSELGYYDDDADDYSEEGLTDSEEDDWGSEGSYGSEGSEDGSGSDYDSGDGEWDSDSGVPRDGPATTDSGSRHAGGLLSLLGLGRSGDGRGANTAAGRATGVRDGASGGRASAGGRGLYPPVPVSALSTRLRGTIEEPADDEQTAKFKADAALRRQSAAARSSEHAAQRAAGDSDDDDSSGSSSGGSDDDDDSDDSQVSGDDDGGGGHKHDPRMQYYATYGKLRKVQSRMMENRRMKKLLKLKKRLAHVAPGHAGFLSNPQQLRSVMKEASDALSRNPNLSVGDLMAGRGMGKQGAQAMEAAQKPKKAIFRLNPNKTVNYGAYFFLGHTNSGKTTALVDMLYYKRHYFKQVIVFSGSQSSVDRFSQYIPASFICDKGFDPLILRRALLEQRKDALHGTAQPLLIVMDDCAHQKNLYLNSPEFMYALKNGRHDKVCIMITQQYYTDLTPEFRNQCMYVFVQKEINEKYLQTLYEAYNTGFDSFAEFKAAVEMCTRDFGTMVLSHDPFTTDEFSSRVFFHRSQKDRKFKMDRGGVMWKYHKRFYDPDITEKTLVDEIKQVQLELIARAMGVADTFGTSRKSSGGGGGGSRSGGLAALLDTANKAARGAKGGVGAGGRSNLFSGLTPEQTLAIMQIATGTRSVNDPGLKARGISSDYLSSLGMLAGNAATGANGATGPTGQAKEDPAANIEFNPGQLYRKKRPVHHDVVVF